VDPVSTSTTVPKDIFRIVNPDVGLTLGWFIWIFLIFIDFMFYNFYLVLLFTICKNTMSFYGAI
jgi:hypothetical protein